MHATQLEERLSRPPREPPFLLVATAFLLFTICSALAGSATWSTSLANGNWNSAPNWSPMTVPSGPADTATFGSSSVTKVSISANTEVDGMVFNPDAPAFTISAKPTFLFFTISGLGINNLSGVTQNFVTVGQTIFKNNATAGNMTVITNLGGENGGVTKFEDNSTAGSAIINNNAGDGTTAFLDNSSAGSATINIYGDNRVNGFGGTTIFADSSTAANATINVYGSSAAGAEKSYLFFEGPSSAGNATLIAYGSSGEGPPGVIEFGGGSNGGTARIELLGNSVLFVDGQITIGSLEGTGFVDVSNFVAEAKLTVGSNNLSTVFSGRIGDESQFGLPPGSFTKIGTGTLVLSGANTYAGGTTVNGGVLQVDNTSGSGTGTGPVTVNSGGKLSGTGTIAGNVLNRGVVSPGDSPGPLHLGGNYSQSSGGTLEIEIASLFSFDQLVVAGTASLSGTLDVMLDGYTGHAGDIFTILTSSGLSGNFLNLDLPELRNGLFFTERVTSNDVILTVNGTTGVPDRGSSLALLADAVAALLAIQCWVVRTSRSQDVGI